METLPVRLDYETIQYRFVSTAASSRRCGLSGLRSARQPIQPAARPNAIEITASVDVHDHEAGRVASWPAMITMRVIQT